jgi:thiamine-monophosphate kinase
MKESKIISSLYRDKKNATKLDDCFFFDGKYLITTDTISELTHFKHEWSSAQNIANKLIEVNVSDIAASGGLPRIAFLNLGLSDFSQKDSWLRPFLKQFKKTLKKYSIQLEGGDTYKSSITSLTLTLIGTARKPIFRHTGNYPSQLYMTGSIGLSMLGYKILKNNLTLPERIKKEALAKHLNPLARLEVSKFLLKNSKISAMMDITDGIVQDCEKLALASNIKIIVEIEKIPRLQELKAYMEIDEILTSGEELELLFLSKDSIHSFKNIPIHCIGKVIKGKPGLEFTLNKRKYSPQKKGFLHFK